MTAAICSSCSGLFCQGAVSECIPNHATFMNHSNQLLGEAVFNTVSTAIVFVHAASDAV